MSLPKPNVKGSIQTFANALLQGRAAARPYQIASQPSGWSHRQGCRTLQVSLSNAQCQLVRLLSQKKVWCLVARTPHCLGERTPFRIRRPTDSGGKSAELSGAAASAAVSGCGCAAEAAGVGCRQVSYRGWDNPNIGVGDNPDYLPSGRGRLTGRFRQSKRRPTLRSRGLFSLRRSLVRGLLRCRLLLRRSFLSFGRHSDLLVMWFVTFHYDGVLPP